LVFDLNNWQIPIESLAKLIREIANDLAHYEALVNKVKAAAKKFDPNRMAEDYERVYINLIKEANNVTILSTPT
jgi:glycosyltransferase involved in cell wall biosynthesis